MRLFIFVGVVLLARGVGAQQYDQQLGGSLGEGYADTRRPSQPQTQLRLTGAELSRQGVTNLAQALALLPEVASHDSRRGVVSVDIRGARQRAVMVLIDGVPVDEPWRGFFDLGTIPITEIVELRVSTSPASPLDGVGGSGGVIEVVTLRARGGGFAAGQLRVSDAPSVQGTATGRADFSKSLAGRASVGANISARTHEAVTAGGQRAGFDENRRDVHGTLRLEAESARGRITADFFAQHRSFLIPPDDEGTRATQIQRVDGEQSFRAIVGGDTQLGNWTLMARGYGQILRRNVIRWADPSLAGMATQERLVADREGLMIEADRPFAGTFVGTLRLAWDSEHAEDDFMNGQGPQSGRSSIVHTAAGLSWRRGNVLIDGAAGMGVPLLGDFHPWPEAKLTIRYSPWSRLDLALIGARKGRLPTLRERFEPGAGNQNLDPENITFGELAATIRPSWLVDLTLAGYVRFTEGLIRTGMNNTLTNIGDITVRGFESSVVIGRRLPISGGGAWNFADAGSDLLGPNPLDFLPQHRADVWAQARWQAKTGIWARLRYIGERVDLGTTLPDYVTVETSAWVQIVNDVRASLRIDNVLGEKFLSRAGLFGEGRRITFLLEGVWQ